MSSARRCNMFKHGLHVLSACVFFPPSKRRHERSAAAHDYGDAPHRICIPTRTHIARMRAHGPPAELTQRFRASAGPDDRAKQPAASGAWGPSSHSERADGQVRDARRVLQEGRDEVCAGVAQHRSRHEPLSGYSQKPPPPAWLPGLAWHLGEPRVASRWPSRQPYSRHDADNVVCPSAEHLSPEAQEASQAGLHDLAVVRHVVARGVTQDGPVDRRRPRPGETPAGNGGGDPRQGPARSNQDDACRPGELKRACRATCALCCGPARPLQPRQRPGAMQR